VDVLNDANILQAAQQWDDVAAGLLTRTEWIRRMVLALKSVEITLEDDPPE
jgi:hypothetical protein